MGVFEHLRPFIFFCQLSGFTPFRMLFHPESKRFKRFVFSWRHPLTCWFIFQTFVQIALPIFEICTYYDHMTNSAGLNNNLPLALYSIAIIGMSFHALLVFLCRYVSVHFSAFHRALERIQRIDSVLVELPDKCQLTLGRRIVVGIIFITIGAATTMFGFSMIYSRMIKDYGIFPTGILISMQIITLCFVGCNFLMMHLSYYLVGYYIRLLGFNLLKGVDDNNKIAWPSTDLKGGTLKSKLRSSKRQFGELCQAAAALHTAFNFPVLCIIVFKLIGLVYTLFVMIYGFLKPQDRFVIAIQSSSLISFFRDFLTLLTVCHAADMPVVQATELREKIIGIITKDILHDSSEKFEALSYLQHINEERVRLSAGGLFHVGVNLFPSLTAAIATYLIVLLQTQTE